MISFYTKKRKNKTFPFTIEIEIHSIEQASFVLNNSNYITNRIDDVIKSNLQEQEYNALNKEILNTYKEL